MLQNRCTLIWPLLCAGAQTCEEPAFYPLPLHRLLMVVAAVHARSVPACYLSLSSLVGSPLHAVY
jgi:hypothetical protein